MICLTFNHEQNVAVVITIENVTFVSFGGICCFLPRFAAETYESFPC